MELIETSGINRLRANLLNNIQVLDEGITREIDKIRRHLTEDRQEAVAQGQEILGPSQVAEQPERPVDRVAGARGDLGAAAEAGEVVADVAVVLLDREGQVLAGEQLLRRDQPVEAVPVVGQEDVALDADLVEQSPAGRVITPTQLPGQGSPCHRVVGSPDPNLVFLPFTKCHISSIWTMPLDGVAEGAGASSPAARTHL